MSQLKLYFKTLILFLIVVALGVGWMYIHEPDVFPIKQVKVDGRYHYVSPKILEKVITPFVSRGFFNVNVSSAQEALSKIPGIDHAYVKRVWPGTVDIDLTEEQAIAKWGKDQLLSKDGDIFKPLVMVDLNRLPTFMTQNLNRKKIVKTYQKIVVQLPKKVSVQWLRYEGNQWTVGFKGLPDVRLGNRKIYQRLHAYFEYLPKVKQKDPDRKIKYLDMRYPIGFAVGWQKTA